MEPGGSLASLAWHDPTPKGGGGYCLDYLTQTKTRKGGGETGWGNLVNTAPRVRLVLGGNSPHDPMCRVELQLACLHDFRQKLLS